MGLQNNTEGRDEFINELRSEGLTDSLISAVLDVIENPHNEDDIKFQTMTDFWKWFNENKDSEQSS